MSKQDKTFIYLNRPVNKEHFRAWVYNNEGRMIVNSYDEFIAAIDSKKWFESKGEIPKPKAKKVKENDADSKGIYN